MGLQTYTFGAFDRRPAVQDCAGSLRPISEPLGTAIMGLDRAVARKAGKSVIQNLADLGGWQAPVEGSERYRMLDAALASRGCPWRFRGEVSEFEGKPSYCHDAWSLLMTCAETATQRDCMDLIRSVPTYGGVSEDAARMAFVQWGLVEIKTRHAEPGDVLMFDMPPERAGGGETHPGGIHAAILSAPGGELSWAMLPGRTKPEPKILHAPPARAVGESWAGPFWTDKLVAAFSFDAPKPGRAALKVAA